MSEEDADRRQLDRLKTLRGGRHSVVAKLCREVDATLEDESFMADPTKVSRLIIISKQLDTKWKALCTLDGEIVSLCPLTEIEGKLNDSEPNEAKLLETKRKINSYVKKGPDELTTSPPAVARQ